MLGKILHYTARIMQLGPRKTVQVVDNKLRKKIFSTVWRQRALRRRAAHSWQYLQKKYQLADFSTFFSITTKRAVPHVDALVPQGSALIAQADAYAAQQFDVLGSGEQQFHNIPWHVDIRLRARDPQADCTFAQDVFYQDMAIAVGEDAHEHKDIKVPWELSRCAHLVVLGAAYKQTHNAAYARAFERQVNSWLDANPFLLGANWVCPMEVGIRAYNWVRAAYLFADCAEIAPAFWQRLTASLYDHLFYLENNWEVYDTRTSNHYLSDLVGYLYVCFFFYNVPGMQAKLQWSFDELVRESNKQIFDEGTSYEGSTAYHRLVTELFYAAYMLAQDAQLVIPRAFEQKLHRMLAFVAWCTPVNGRLVTIGDHDSGHVLHNRLPLLETCGRSDFPAFGLSIMKTDRMHLTLRQHAFQAHQPSGHFHNDVGSITLAVDGIPVIVDPASYIYTPSRAWRNYFRSVAVHNAFYVEGHEPVPFDERLFALNVPPHAPEIALHESLKMQHSLYQRLRLIAKRNIAWNNDTATLCIADVWQGDSAHVPTVWNFTLGHEIEGVQEGQSWQLQYNGKLLATLHSPNLVFTAEPAWISLEYGSKVATTCLCARRLSDVGQEVIVYVSLTTT